MKLVNIWRRHGKSLVSCFFVTHMYYRYHFSPSLFATTSTRQVISYIGMDGRNWQLQIGKPAWLKQLIDKWLKYSIAWQCNMLQICITQQAKWKIAGKQQKPTLFHKITTFCTWPYTTTRCNIRKARTRFAFWHFNRCDSKWPQITLKYMSIIQTIQTALCIWTAYVIIM